MHLQDAVARLDKVTTGATSSTWLHSCTCKTSAPTARPATHATAVHSPQRPRRARTCRPQIVKGRVEKTVRQMCLLEAPWIKGVERSVDEVIAATTAKLGEKISVRRFMRRGLLNAGLAAHGMRRGLGSSCAVGRRTRADVSVPGCSAGQRHGPLPSKSLLAAWVGQGGTLQAQSNPHSPECLAPCAAGPW